jgi:hypothetical protein
LYKKEGGCTKGEGVLKKGRKIPLKNIKTKYTWKPNQTRRRTVGEEPIPVTLPNQGYYKTNYPKKPILGRV